jgi:hypothetical protein
MNLPSAFRRRLITALGAATLACSAIAVILATPGTAAATPAAARAEMARTNARAPKARASRLPVFAIIRDGDTLRVLRGETARGDGRAFTRRMRALPTVLAAGVDGPVHIATVNDPKRSQQWALDAVDYEDAWATTNGTGVKVALVDTGVRSTHEDLTGGVDNGANCVSATTNSQCTTTVGATNDDNGHGTHVAGILAAHVNNALGIAGSAPGVRILPVKVLDAAGNGTYAGVAMGILWAADHGAKVISMSLTGAQPAESDGVQSAINTALAKNITVIAAAGNNYYVSGSTTAIDNSKMYPASYPGVLSVGAIQDTTPYTRASFSNTTSNVGIVAPGNSIVSTYNASNTSYKTMSGTSMATPYVTAAAAMLLAKNSSLSPVQVITTLESTATHLDSDGTGTGLVNPIAALAAVPATTTTSTSTTTTNPLASTSSTTSTTTTTVRVVQTSTPGYWVAGRDGRVRNFGLSFYGDRVGHTSGPVVAMAATKTHKGYWLATANGAVYNQGDAVNKGSRAGQHNNAPFIAMAASTTGQGYWLLGADGGIFTYGDAKFFGSTGARKLNAPIVDFAPTPTGKGYWLLGADGGVFTFGDAKYFGSTGSMKLAAPVVSMSPNPNGGYWLIARDGGVFTFGPNYYGSLVSRGIHKTIVRLRVTPAGKGYWILANDGSVYAFGDAPNRGSAAMNPAVDIAVG